VSTSVLAVHHGGGIGGAPVSLLKLLGALDPSEFRAEAIFTEPGPIVGYAHELGVPARVVPTGGAFFYSAHARLGPRSLAQFLRTFPGAVVTARRALKRARPDLLHLNTSVLLAWAAAARRERLPVVWMVREVLGQQPLVRRWHARFMVRRGTTVVAISDCVRACFPSHARIRRVYNAVDLREFSLDLLKDAPALRTALGLKPDRYVLGVVGAVQRVKGHWLVLDALRHAELNMADLLLVTGGAPPEYGRTARGRVKRALGLPLDNLAALLRDADRFGLGKRIHVTGFRRDVARILSVVDVLVFPSLAPEGFGRPIIEAMALARPVVATDVGPSAELLGVDAGKLVAPDADRLAHTVASLLCSPEERAHMGRAGRARVEACFTLDRQVADMAAVYREALAIG
jgi:glycosyltransferase involved in cell wall biosynthesis